MMCFSAGTTLLNRGADSVSDRREVYARLLELRLPITRAGAERGRGHGREVSPGRPAHEMDELSHVHAACVVRMRAVAVILRFLRKVLRKEPEESHHHLCAAAITPQWEKPISEPCRIRAREVVPRVHKQVEDPIRVLLHPQADVEFVLGELRPLAVSPYPEGGRAMDVVVGGLDHVHELMADEVVITSTFHPGVDPDVTGVQEVVKSGEVVAGVTAEESALMMDRVSTGVGSEGTISLLVVSPGPPGEIENPIRLRPVHIVIEVNGGVIIETDKTD